MRSHMVPITFKNELGPLRTERSQLVRGFQNFVVWSEICKLDWFDYLFTWPWSRSGPRTRTDPLGSGPIGFGPWIPCKNKFKDKS